MSRKRERWDPFYYIHTDAQSAQHFMFFPLFLASFTFDATAKCSEKMLDSFGRS
jgi:hypothetical protein